MIIGACGFGETGSGAVIDYLKEFEVVKVKDDMEFTYVSSIDGLLYLERAVMNSFNRTSDSIYGIKKFLDMVNKKKGLYKTHGLSTKLFEESARLFVDRITMVKWYWGTKRYRYRSRYFFHQFMVKKVIARQERKTGHRAKCWPLKEVRLSMKPDNFYDAAREHIDELLKGMGLDQDRIIALNQPFAANNPQVCFPFFKDPYAIVVDRDPRDLYVSGKTNQMGKWHFFPIDNVDDFIIYYRTLRKDQPYTIPNPRILNIRFEDLIYEYENTTQRLRDFLSLPENPKPRTLFNPDLSIANTQVFKRYTQFAEDVHRIEDALPEYLYDFSKYPEPDFSKKMFLR